MVAELFGAIEEAGITAAIEAMTSSAQMVAARAKEKAPVRRVFKGQNEAVHTRLKSIGEIEADRSVRRQLGLGPENVWVHPPSVVTKAAPRMLHMREVVQGDPNMMKRPAAQLRLDRRGRYELKSGRALTAGSQLGGTLRDEIFSESAKLEGNWIRTKVVSPTRYAKFQEFGTRHNPAHPYLRPAGHESIDEIRAAVGTGVARAARAALRPVVWKVTWHLVAGG